MSKQDVIDYVMHTPYNTNKAVLRSLLEGIGGESFPEFKIPLEEMEEPISISTSITNEILSAEEGDLFELDGVGGIGLLSSIDGPHHTSYEGTNIDGYNFTFAIINSDDEDFGFVTCGLAVTTSNNQFLGYGFESASGTSSDLPIIYGTINNERLHMSDTDYVITLDGSFSLDSLPEGFLYLTNGDNCGLIGFNSLYFIIESSIYEIISIDAQTRQITCSFCKRADKSAYLYKTIFDNQTTFSIHATILSNYEDGLYRTNVTLDPNKTTTLKTDVTTQPYWIRLYTDISALHFNCTSANSSITVYKNENVNSNDDFIIEVSPDEENDIPIITISRQS